MFGRVRLEAVEFIRIAVEKFSQHLSSALIELDLFKSIVALFYEFPSHSILHFKLSDILKSGLKCDQPEIVDNILYQSDLFKKILELKESHFSFDSSSRSARQGYFSFMIDLANFIAESENSEVKSLTDSTPEWHSFTQ